MFMYTHSLSKRGEHEFGGRHEKNWREEERQMQFSYIKFLKKLKKEKNTVGVTT